MGNYTGTSGDDTFLGSGGADTMTGLAGNDTYYVDDAGDVVVEESGGGLDRVAASVSYILAANAEIETLEAVNSAATNAMDLTGNNFVNAVIGNAGTNLLFGLGGNDQLLGNGGNDFLVGGTGADLMYGGTGNDTFYVDDLGDRAYELAGEGTDRIATTISYTLDDASEVELLEATNTLDTNAMDLTGSNSANQIIGNSGTNLLFGLNGNDQLIGLAGSDFLVGGTGADIMYGGTGNDTYYVDDLGDRAFEAAGEGNDRIATTISYTLDDASEVELLESTNTADTNAMDLTGSNSANQIIGNSGVNLLFGLGGNDVLIALAGNDFLVGGTGFDAMYGGAGNDTYYVDSALDQANELAGEGNDRVATSVSYTLSAEIETLEAVNSADTGAMDLTGNAIANTIAGTAGANLIDGKGGSDLLMGFGGADTFAFTAALGAGNVDQIADFTLNLDRILLGGDSGEPFAALAAGPLAAASFIIGSAAAQIDDYVIYNSITGALLYDADGSGAGAAVQFATLAPGLALTAAHFTVGGATNAAPAVSSPASASIAENNAASAIVYQATATDTQGDRVIWSLTGTDAHRLTIDAVTGAVRLKAPADFEARSTYSFNVVASDSSASTAKAVTLNVSDLSNEDSATTRIFETPSLNGDTSQAQSITVFSANTNPNLYNDDLPSIYILGSIFNNVDDDYFSISLSAGQLLILDVDGAPTTLDTLLRVYSSGGTLLAENDDTGVYDPGSLTPPKGHNKDSMLFFRAETSGTYYFSIESFGHDSNGSYKLNVSVGPSATPAQLLSQDVDALLSGLFWDRATPALTYGFPTAASQYPGTAFTEVDPASKFSPFTAFQIDAITEMLATVANVSGLSFQRDTATPGLADLRYGMTTEGDPAYAYLPTNEGPESPGGSVWFDKIDFNSPVIGNYAWMGMLHETGHALGLKHAHETPLAVSEDRDSVEYTVMAYRSYPGQDIETVGYTNETWGYAQSLMMLDIAALQRLYGANFNHNAGDTVYTWNSSTGEMSVDGVGQGRPGDNGNGSTPSSANRVFLTVWDGNGNDTYDMSNYSFGVRIDLRPGEWSRTSTVQLANLGDGHTARGNVANALLYNGDARSLIENAIGGAGGDRLIANQAANKLTGNAGNDVFQWTSHTDAGIGALADRIMDFVSGTDKIDLGEVDAFPFSSSTNETFTFIGTAAFSGANQLRYEVIDGHAHIFADLNNNRVADFEIVVMNVTTLVATDFVL